VTKKGDAAAAGSGTMVVHELRAASRTLKWYEWFPFANLVYEFLFDEPPTISSVKEIMNALGLVCALLLGVVITLPSSVSYDELMESNERFATEPELLGYVNQMRDTPIDKVFSVKYGACRHARASASMCAGPNAATLPWPLLLLTGHSQARTATATGCCTSSRARAAP
jgi:hypothetical protein